MVWLLYCLKIAFLKNEKIKPKGYVLKIIKKQFYVYPPIMMLSLYLTTLGYMIPIMQNKFSLSLFEAGLFSSLQSVGLILSIILCFSIFSSLNKSRILLFGLSGLCLSVVLLGINNIAGLLFILFFFIGFFNNIVDTMSNAMIVDISESNKELYVGLLHGLWAFMGAVGPYFVIIIGGEYKITFVAIGFVMLISALIYYLGLKKDIKSPMMVDKSRLGGMNKLIRVVGKKGIPLAILVTFFSAATQVTLIFFLSAYIRNIRNSPNEGAIILSMFFVGLLIGRITYAKIGYRYDKYTMLAITNTIGLVAFSIMLMVNSFVLISVFALIGGICIASNIPAMVMEACKLIPNDTAAASSLIIFGMALSNLLIPPIIGRIGDAMGLKMAILIGVGFTVFVVVLCSKWFLSLRGRD